MKSIALIIFSFFIIQANAIEKKLELDLNHDGKVDRIEIYKDNVLVSLERDVNFTGHIDEWITYTPYLSSDKAVQVVKKDTNHDGKVDRIETYFRNPELQLYIVTTEVDSKFDGHFDKKWTTQSKLNQESEENPCLQNIDLESLNILKLRSDVGKIKNSLEDGFYKTDWGYKIHQSCLDNWGGAFFPQMLQSSMQKGFQCLARLAKENARSNPTKPNGAYNNLKSFEHLITSGKVSVVCNEKKYDWSTDGAHASSGPSESIAELGIKHPFVSINTKYPATKLKPTQVEIDYIAQTVFHEQFHNLGFLHEDDIEYPYTCGTCCFTKEKGEKKNDACKVCSGGYSEKNDKNYILDVISWGKSSYQKERAAKAVMKYEEEFPGDRFGLFAYAEASTGIFSPVGIELEKILVQKFPKRTPKEDEIIGRINYYSNEKSLMATSKFSKLVAESHFILFYEQDSKKVLTFLEINSDVIKELIGKQKTAKGDDQYIYKDIQNQLKGLLMNIFLRGYPNNKNRENIHAFNILKSQGLI